MTNFIELLSKCVAISEVIIQATKEKVKAKLKPEIWSSIVLGVVGAFGIAFDIVFNAPIINPEYVFTAIGFEAILVLCTQISYDKCLQILEIIKDLMKHSNK